MVSTTTETSTATSTLTQAFSFGLAVTPSSDVVAQGGSDTPVVTVQLTGGSPASVALSATGAPQGLSVSFSPPSGQAGFVSAMHLDVSSSLSPGRYKMTVVAQANQITQSQEFDVTVTASHPNKFTLTTVSPSGSGTVSPTPSNYTHSANDLVTVSAAPDSGWYLDHWLVNGVPAGNGLSLSLIMTGNVQVQAVFSDAAQKGAPSPGSSASVSFLTNGVSAANLTIDGQSYPLPVSFNWPIGSNHTAQATDIMGAGNQTRVLFSGWGGASNSTQQTLSFKVTGNSNLIANYKEQVHVSMSYTTSGGTPVTPTSAVINGPNGFETLGSANSTLWLDANTTYTLVSAQVMGVNADPLNQGSASFVVTKPESLTFPLSVYPVQLKLVDLFSQPIAGAKVSLTTEGGQVLHAVTDAKGVASFDAVPSGWFQATYSYLGVSGNVQDLSPGQHLETVTLALSYPLISVGLVMAGVVAFSGVRAWRRQRYISTAFD